VNKQTRNVVILIFLLIQNNQRREEERNPEERLDDELVLEPKPVERLLVEVEGLTVVFGVDKRLVDVDLEVVVDLEESPVEYVLLVGV
jgi:hypothetical protein